MTSIGEDAFATCGSVNISVGEGNSAYCDVDGVLFSKDKKTLVVYAKDKIQSEYVIPNGTETIEKNAFSFCAALTGITIPDSITSIGEDAFFGCDSLTDVNYSGTQEDWNNIETGESNDELLGAVIHCSDGVINASVTGLLEFDAAAGTVTGCDERAAGELVIPAEIGGVKVTAIGDSAFMDCGELTGVTIPEGVESIGESAFEECVKLASVELPDSLTSIGGSAFSDCYALTSIDIPKGVTIISDGMLAACESLVSVTIPEGVTSIGNSAFCLCDKLTDINLPNGLESIDYSAFDGCTSLTSIRLPDSVTSVNGNAFGHNISISVGEGNKTYCDIDGVLFSKDKKTIVSYSKDMIQPEYTIPEGTESIGEDAFYACEYMTDLNIPSSVSSIGTYAFAGCELLTSVTIPEGAASIGEGTFDYCGKLTDVYYSGTAEDWNNIDIGEKNDELLGAENSLRRLRVCRSA